MKIKTRIEQKFGTINKFVDSVFNETTLSRTYLYKLINNTEANPTMETMIELARITEIPLEEIIDEYSNRYRNSGVEDKR
jgi:DNA-binding phage protein